MAIDASIALNANRPEMTPYNPLQMQGQVAQTAATILNARRAQAQLGALQAQGQAAQGAIGPDGVYDPLAANRAMASNPAAAYGIQDAITGNQGLQQAQQTRSQGAQAHVNQTLTSMLSLPDTMMTPATVKQGLDQLRANGSISAQDEQAALSDIPQQGGAGAIRQMLVRHTVANLAGPAAVQTVTGTPTVVEDGQQKQPGVVAGPFNPAAPYGAITPAGGATRMQLSPEAASTPTPIGTTRAGQIIQGTRQQFIDGATGQQPQLGNGRFPAALRNPANQSAAPAVPGVVTSVGPAQQAALEQQGSASAKAFSDLADQGNQARSQNAVLGNMLADTTNFTPGPSNVNNYKATLTKYAPSLASSLGVSPESVAANESFDKLASQIALAQGAGSDSRLSVAGTANPSSHLSAAGADQIIRQLQGNADYTMARSKLAATYPDQSNRAKFEADVGGQLDPRAFQFARLTPAQKVTYANSLSAEDRKTVQGAYNYAHHNKLIGDAGG